MNGALSRNIYPSTSRCRDTGELDQTQAEAVSLVLVCVVFWSLFLLDDYETDIRGKVLRHTSLPTFLSIPPPATAASRVNIGRGVKSNKAKLSYKILACLLRWLPLQQR